MRCNQNRPAKDIMPNLKNRRKKVPVTDRFEVVQNKTAIKLIPCFLAAFDVSKE